MVVISTTGSTEGSIRSLEMENDDQRREEKGGEDRGVHVKIVGCREPIKSLLRKVRSPSIGSPSMSLKP